MPSVSLPTLMMAGSAAATAAGAGISAAGTIAGGANAAQLGRMRQQGQEFQATQDIQNSAADIAGAQRTAIDTGQRANLLRSSAVANAAAGGVVTNAGSALTNESQIASRGKYAAALDLWKGQNEATADLNKAAAAHYTGLLDEMGGEMEKEGSKYAALATLASAGGSIFKLYGGGGPPKTT